MTAKEEVRERIQQFFQAMDTQNLSMMEELIPRSETTVHVGTDKNEIWKGWKVLQEATRQQFENLDYYKANIHDLTITISDNQKVAWYFHRLDAEIKSGASITRWQGARFTGVLEKENGQWKLAQTHVSIPESA